MSLDRPLWVRESRLFGLRRAIVQSFGKGRGCDKRGEPIGKLSRSQAEAMLVRHGARNALTRRWCLRADRARAR